MTQRGRTALAAIAATTLGLALSACGGSGSGDHSQAPGSTGAGASSTAGDAFAPGSKVDVATARQMITDGFGGDGTVHMGVTMTGQVQASGTGDMDFKAKPAKGSFTLSSSTLGGGSIAMLMVDDAMYLKAQQFGPKYLKVSMAGKNNLASRAGLGSLDPTAMFDSLADRVAGGTYVGKESLDGASTDHYTFSLDKAAGSPATMQAWFDSDGRYRQIRAVSGGNTVTETFSDWGEPVTVTAPPAAQVKDMTQMLKGALGSK
jgi:hypothetical protein